MKTWQILAPILVGTMAISSWGVTPLVFAQGSSVSALTTSAPKIPAAVIHGKNFVAGTAAVNFGATSTTGSATKKSVTISPLPASSDAVNTPTHRPHSAQL